MSWNSIEKVFMKFCVSVDSGKSLAAYMMCKYREYDQLARHSCDPADYMNEDLFALDYQVTSFVRKCPLLPVTSDPVNAARRAAVSAELQCHNTNLRLFGEIEHLDERFYRILCKAEKIIKYVLGDEPPDISEWSDKCRFGPGVSSSAKRYVDVFNKTISRLDVTPKSLPYATRLLELRPELFNVGYSDFATAQLVKFNLIEHNTWTSVPKTALTDRPICVEPHVNMVLQLGIGSVLRDRLKRIGLDLNHQQDVNRFLASKAYEWNLSTIDFSSASDTISVSFVKMLLPPKWFTLLDDLRCHYTKYDDAYRLNSKFSSMGNGFTFELETLLFYALCLACVNDRRLTSCFGDDVILPRENAVDFIDIATFCGLIVNRQKSYVQGAFYESCGQDYFKGSNVRPYFCKLESIDDQSVYSMANGIRHAGSRRLAYMGTDSRYKRAWHATLDLCTERYAGPSRFGDTVIWANPGDFQNLLFPTPIPGGYLSTGVEVSGNTILRETNHWFSVGRKRFRHVTYRVPKLLAGNLLQLHLQSLERVTDDILKSNEFLYARHLSLCQLLDVAGRSYSNSTRSTARNLTRVTRHCEIRSDACLFI